MGFLTNLLTQWCNWGHHLKKKRMKTQLVNNSDKTKGLELS
jgi:hypothetical protein